MNFLRTSAIATIVVAACFFGTLPRANAGTLPNISGTWYAQGNHSKPCHITQSGTHLTLTSEVDSPATGVFTDPSTISASWSTMPHVNTLSRNHYIGHISQNLTTIHWSNGTFWTR